MLLPPPKALPVGGRLGLLAHLWAASCDDTNAQYPTQVDQNVPGSEQIPATSKPCDKAAGGLGGVHAAWWTHD